MALAVTGFSFTLSLRDVANLAGISESLITTAGGGRITASTNYTKTLSNTDNFKYVCFGGVLTDGTRVPGLFTGIGQDVNGSVLQVATGATVTATDTVTISVLANNRSSKNLIEILRVLRQLILPNSDPRLPSGVSPSGLVTWDAT